jgi:hypothetical protein
MSDGGYRRTDGMLRRIAFSATLPAEERLLSIGGGADEVMLSIICKLMGTLPGVTNR